MARHAPASLVIAVLVALVPLGAASAHDYEAKTKGYIDNGGASGASGHITSMVDACLRNRRVTLFREQDGADKSYGYDMTNRSGEWNVDSNLLAGMYYIKVKPRDIGDSYDDHEHLCLRTTSIKYQL